VGVSASEGWTPSQISVVGEIRRIAEELGKSTLSQREFDEHHQLSGVSTAGYQFGSWNDAVAAAGLEPVPPGGAGRGPKISDEELLEELLRLRAELGGFPSLRKLAKFGRFSEKPYRARWGSLKVACDAAAKLGDDWPAR